MRKKNLKISRRLAARRRIKGAAARPRLAVFRSNKHIYAQIIDDSSGQTLVAESDSNFSKKGAKKDQSYEVGKSLGIKAVKKGLKSVIFDRRGYKYHGRVERLAAGAREGGLKF